MLVGWHWWPLKTSCLWWPVRGSGSGGCSRSWRTYLVCRRLVCHSPFKKWISFLYLRLGRLPPWPSWEDVKASMAECFRANYPDTFIVLDATELCTEIRSCLALQSLLYSSYKSHTTLKDLIVISPNGSIYFVSELWSGSISDRELVIKVARNEVEKASFAQRSAHRDSRIWRPELIEPAAERKRRARGWRPTFKSAYPDPQILPQCNISSNYPLYCLVFLSQQT